MPRFTLFCLLLAVVLIAGSGSADPAEACAASNNALWAASSAVDGNPATLYSSNVFANATAVNGTYLAVWAAGPQAVSQVYLQANMSKGYPTAFPQVYQLYVTTPTNSNWMALGYYTDQPNAQGLVTVQLPGIYETHGVMIKPIVSGQDFFGNNVFQLADVWYGAGANQVSQVPGQAAWTSFQLGQNQSVSGNGITLVMQGDGNLVAYNGKSPVFASNTSGQHCAPCVAYYGAGNLSLFNGMTRYYTVNLYGPGGVLTLSPTYPILNVVPTSLLTAPKVWLTGAQATQWQDFMNSLVGAYGSTGNAQVYGCYTRVEQDNIYLENNHFGVSAVSWSGMVSMAAMCNRYMKWLFGGSKGPQPFYSPTVPNVSSGTMPIETSTHYHNLIITDFSVSCSVNTSCKLDLWGDTQPTWVSYYDLDHDQIMQNIENNVPWETNLPSFDIMIPNVGEQDF